MSFGGFGLGNDREGPLRRRAVVLTLLAIALGGGAAEILAQEPSGERTPWRGPQPAEGKVWPTDSHFFQRHWFQMGDEFANPSVNRRFRVNGPYAATNPKFHDRREPKGNGMMLVPMDVPLRSIDAARLYLELWGGHPHSTNRRVTINGRSTYTVEVPDEDHCSHAYRDIQIKITDLVEGQNALQFAVDGDETFWGHFIVEEAAIDALLPAGSELLRDVADAAGLTTEVNVDASVSETFRLILPVGERLAAKIARVHYFAKYDGFDENGDGVTLDWHGMTKHREPIGHVGTADEAPYEVLWDTSMIAAQDDVQFRALIEFVGDEKTIASEQQSREQGNRFWKAQSLHLQTSPSEKFSITHPEGIEVVAISGRNASVPFWSRAGRRRRCEFLIDVDPGRIEKAMLSVCVWDGGAGDVQDYFQLNGHALTISANAKHDVIESNVDVQPEWLVSGVNEAVLLSDTIHHGIEVLFPGPTVTIRYHAP